LDNVEGMRLISVIEPVKTDNTWLATARIQVSKIFDVRDLPSTFSLKKGRRLRPCLEKTREFTFKRQPRCGEIFSSAKSARSIFKAGV
jgi:hypothetical protein